MMIVDPTYGFHDVGVQVFKFFFGQDSCQIFHIHLYGTELIMVSESPHQALSLDMQWCQHCQNISLLWQYRLGLLIFSQDLLRQYSGKIGRRWNMRSSNLGETEFCNWVLTSLKASKSHTAAEMSPLATSGGLFPQIELTRSAFISSLTLQSVGCKARLLATCKQSSVSQWQNAPNPLHMGHYARISRYRTLLYRSIAFYGYFSCDYRDHLRWEEIKPSSQMLKNQPVYLQIGWAVAVDAAVLISCSFRSPGWQSSYEGSEPAAEYFRSSLSAVVYTSAGKFYF